MTKVRLGVSVMAHPSRRGYVNLLMPRLDGDPPVIWDRYHDRWDTGRRALLAGSGTETTHWMVVQDDTVVPRDLIAGVARMLEHVPDGIPVDLYLGHGRTQPRRFRFGPLITRAKQRGVSFMEFEGPWWGQGIVVPTADIDEVVQFGDDHPEIENYDHKIANWYARRGVHCWYTMPSLVSHRTDGDSLVPGRRNTRGRVAAWFVGEGRSALDVDWTGGVMQPWKIVSGFPPTPHTPGWRSR